MSVIVLATPTPRSVQDPAGVWVFDWVVPAVGGLIMLASVLDCVRRRQLSWGFLFLSNSMLVYWMETVGDWAQHLVYSPAFRAHHLLDWLPLKTSTDPLFMPFAYAIYWTVHAVAVLWLGQLLVRKYGWSLLTAIAVISLPVNYLWDIAVESAAVSVGWWTYDPGFGPVIEFANGGRQPLMWPVLLMTFWPNLIAYWAGKPPVRTLNHIERLFRLDRLTRPAAPAPEPAAAVLGQSDRASGPAEETRRSARARYDGLLDYQVIGSRWRFELARFGAWFVVFQASFFVMLIIPLVTLRIATGHDSDYLPPNTR
ncbi:MAG: hypothetical protein J2P32_04100 [Actinobacteria bacterium]|nr:hypothetical protein [Actinomycetota bacterium]